MSITITSQMFSKLSPEAKEEVMASFRELDIDEVNTSPVWVRESQSYLPPWKPYSNTSSVSSPFESASLSFSKPLALPSSDTLDLKKKTVRQATKVPIAVYSDIYSLKTQDEIDDIISDIDLGYFVGPSSWERGQKHHPENFDVRRVLQILRSYGPQNNYFINTKLMTLCRTRIAAILRQLKIQGVVKVNSAI